jgi:hypothetical protein
MPPAIRTPPDKEKGKRPGNARRVGCHHSRGHRLVGGKGRQPSKNFQDSTLQGFGGKKKYGDDIKKLVGMTRLDGKFGYEVGVHLILDIPKQAVTANPRVLNIRSTRGHKLSMDGKRLRT